MPAPRTSPATGPSLLRITRPRIGDEIEVHLTREILNGRYRHGERLSPSALAEEFDTSPMPVREALISLNAAGLVEMVARRGFRVARLSWRDVEDAFEVQAFVTGRLAEYAAAVITAEQVDDLWAIQAEIERIAPDGPDAAAQIDGLNYAFHRTLNHQTGAEHLLRFLRVATVIPHHLHAEVPEWIQATVQEHPPIIRALAAHDGPRARKLARDHIRNAGALVVEHLARGASREDQGPTIPPTP